jgi:hypothetical protein
MALGTYGSAVTNDLRDLRLRDFRPVPRLVAPAHIVERARFPAVDAPNHLGRWLSGWLGRPFGD